MIIFGDPRTNVPSVVDEIIRITSISMNIQRCIIELQSNLPSDEKHARLRVCMDDSKKSLQTVIKKLCKGYTDAVNLELEV